jgi:hypothetical protein
VAELKIHHGGQQLLSAPLRALDDNPVGSLWQRARDSISLWFE